MMRFRARPVIHALLTALLVWAGGMVTLDAVDARTRPPPESLALPDPQIGDRGTYDFRLLEGAGGTAKFTARDHIAFDWRPARPVLDGSGYTRHGWVLNQTEPNFMMGGDVPMGVMPSMGENAYRLQADLHLFDPGSLERLAERMEMVYDGKWTRQEPAGWVEVTEHRWLNSTSLAVTTGPHRSLFGTDLCGLRNAFQGANLSLHEPLRLVRPGCEAAGGWFDDPWFVADRGIRWRGDECVVFRQTPPQPDRRLDVALCEGLPYPAWLEVHHLEYQDLVSRYELTDFERGSERYPPVAGPQAAVTETLEWAPARPWGPDDSGLEHPFPASEAYYAAYHDPANATLREFNPDNVSAVLTSLYYDEVLSPGLAERQWRMVFTNDTHRLNFEIQRTTSTEHDDIRRQYYQSELNRYEVPASRIAAPDRLPTAGSLMRVMDARFEAQGVETQANGWGLHWGYPGHHCFPSPDGELPDDCAPRLSLSASEDRTLRAAIGDDWTVNGTELRVDRHVGLRQDGAITGERESIIKATRRPTEGGAATGPATAGGGGLPLRSIAIQAPDWDPPARAVELGVAALVVGALVWLWGQTKHLVGFALFSRIRKPGALDHPTRAEIHQALEQEPGLSIEELGDRTGVPRSTLSHHLRKLVDVGLVDRIQVNGRACHFVRRGIGRRERRARAVLKSERLREIVGYVASHPDADGRDVARALRLDEGTVSYHLNRLDRWGLVNRSSDGRRKVVRLSDAMRRALDASATEAAAP